VNGVVWAGAYTFLAAGALRGCVDARVLMNLERRLADNVVGTGRDAFPARLTLMGIQANESSRPVPDERTMQFHKMPLMV
jgi:hypothetical protein